MAYSFVDIERRGKITIVTINRPDSYNALNPAASYELSEIFDDFARDDAQWVAIVTGAGTKAFCAGMDLKQQASGGAMETPASGFGGLASRFDLNKPVIAAVNGIAMGGGFELALACDIIVAASHAKFALPEPKVGLAALGGGLHRLPRAIGMTRAMTLLLTGKTVSAKEAFDLGFVSEIVEGDALTAALRWAEELLQCSPMAVRATKEAVRLGSLLPLEDAIADQWKFPAMTAMLGSEDAKEGPLAFSEKRLPEWKNR